MNAEAQQCRKGNMEGNMKGIKSRGFRVYDKKEKRMIDTPADEHIFLSGNGNLVNIDHPDWYLMDRYVRMDSTGLADKNGKEVYGGNIVQRYGEGRYKVYWHEFTARWRMDGHTGITKGDMALACEVINNIYENPE